ncbi:leucine-rich repeat domain-containing protein [Ruminococcus sp.]|uniref:leucine-rich repeat domain-containing protein n=1 Tax=Ruminococcus sp. TaxID=41978 RepID=UPI0025F2448D|nr:leucine-rich repeat domain-containing protein [Ruminococcus sp.]
MLDKLFSDETYISGAETEGLLYSVHDGEAVVTGFTGRPEYIDIPDFFSCYPVTELRDNAFYKCETLRGIDLPDTVARIGHHCFYACDKLEAVRLPDGLEEIGEGCFCGCVRLSDITLPASLDKLPDSCFRACVSLSDVKLPQGLKSIGELCFSDCEGLESISTGNELSSIGSGAFYMCPKLERIYIPPVCTYIGDQALGFDCNGNQLITNEHLVILGAEDSAAERYAFTNGVAFSCYNGEDHTAAGLLSAPKALKKADIAAFSGAAVFAVLIISLLRRLFLQKKV